MLKSVKSQQKKKKFISNELKTLDGITNVNLDNYHLVYFKRLDGTYSIIKMYGQKQWSIYHMLVDYKTLRAWKNDDDIVKTKEANKFESKYKNQNINFDF